MQHNSNKKPKRIGRLALDSTILHLSEKGLQQSGCQMHPGPKINYPSLFVASFCAKATPCYTLQFDGAPKSPPLGGRNHLGFHAPLFKQQGSLRG